MTIFDLEIRHPHHHSDEEAEFMEDMAAQDLMAKFNAMNWKQLQILMLQMRGGKAVFTVTHHASNQAVKISLIELPDTGALAFNLESDIEVQAVQKNLFGLLKYKAADYVQFRHLSLPATRSYLEAFSRQQLDQLKQDYLQRSAEAVS